MVKYIKTLFIVLGVYFSFVQNVKGDNMNVFCIEDSFYLTEVKDTTIYLLIADTNSAKWLDIICAYDSTKCEIADSGYAWFNLGDPFITTDCYPVDISYTMKGATEDNGIGAIGNKKFNVGTTTVTYTAIKNCVLAEHILVFDSWGGTSVDAQMIREGELAFEPYPPTKEGYIFMGWYYDISYIQQWDFNLDRVYSDMTLYARWDFDMAYTGDTNYVNYTYYNFTIIPYEVSTCSFTVVVNPVPIVNKHVDEDVCDGVLTNTIFFDGSSIRTIYNWTNNNTLIGLTSGGTGDIQPFTPANSTSAPIEGIIAVTPVYTFNSVSCTGSSENFKIIVHPLGVPQVNIGKKISTE